MIPEAELEEKSLSMQKRTQGASKLLYRAFTLGAATARKDAEKVLKAYAYKEGMSRAEAEAFLRQPATPETIEDLRAKARSLSKPQRLKALAEIDRRAYLFRFTVKEALAETLRIQQMIIGEDISRRFRPIYEGLAAESYGRAMFEIQMAVGVASVATLPYRRIDAVLKSNLSMTRMFRTASNAVTPIKEILIAGILNGKSVGWMAKEMGKKDPTLVYRSKAIARTSITEVSNEAERRAYKANGLKMYTYRATLDERTCPICGGLDGRSFRLDDAKKGKNFPPMHPNCRCVHVGKLNRSVEAKLKRAGRDENGKPILLPASTTYEEWAKKYLS